MITETQYLEAKKLYLKSKSILIKYNSQQPKIKNKVGRKLFAHPSEEEISFCLELIFKEKPKLMYTEIISLMASNLKIGINSCKKIFTKIVLEEKIKSNGPRKSYEKN
jgi:hypothetical protein